VTALHFEAKPGFCLCGEPWIGAMICHPCRFPGHRPQDCVDGGRTDGPSRWCACQHQKTPEQEIVAESPA
jgi:hypothetical protein